MKKIIIFITLIAFSVISYSQELESNALMIKEKYNTLYEKTIKKYALLKWKDDFNMVVYEINKQSDALVNIVDKFESKYTNILFKAVIKWSHEGKKEYNEKVWDNFKYLGISSMLELEVDWNMVQYEYEKQVKAANAF